MLKDLKNTAKHSFVYAIGNIGTKLIGFLLIPFYTNPNLLSTSEYGALAVLEASLQVLVGVLSFAMANSLSRWYWDKNYLQQQKSIFFSSFTFLLAILTPSLLALSYFSGQFSLLLFGSLNYSLLIKLTIFTAGFQIVNNLVLTLLRLKSKSLIYVGVQLFKLVGLLLLIIWGLKVKNLGLFAVWRAYLIVEIISLLILLPTVIKNIKLKLHFNILKEMLTYGLPLMLASLSSVLLAVTDRYMLNSMQGLERTAVYSVGYRIANTLKMVVTMSLSLALLPLQMKKIGEKGSEVFYARIFKYSSFLFSMALLALTLFSLEILKLITGSSVYWEANTVVAIISFALLFGQLKNDALIGITIKKKTKITGTLVFVTSIVNILLNILLIPLWDIYGAAFATLISQMFFFATIYYYAQKVYKIPYELKNVIVLITLLAIYVITGLVISDVNIYIRLIVKSLLLVTFPFALAIFRYYSETENNTLMQLFETWRRPSEFKNNIKNFLK